MQVWKAEIETPAFRKFLAKALQSCLQLSKAEAANPEDLMPWKKLGRRWHELRKGLPGSGRVPWEFGLLEHLLPTVETALEGLAVEYGLRSKINWSRPESETVVAELHTKRSDGVDLCLYCRPGDVTIGAIASLGESQTITADKGRDLVRIRFTTESQARAADVKKFLQTVGPRLSNN
ncbi:MAG UNVERIFIED_CONTAM: hypothetical protein LVR18_10465 [Planctomycetaceae bacterium]